MGKIETVIVDSDGLVALFLKEDAHSDKAVKILQMLSDKGVRLLYPATAITETTALFQRRFNKPHIAAQITQMIVENEIEIEPVDEGTIQSALTYFKPEEGSRHNTLFDAIVAALAKKYKAAAIFSFDKWYASLGFTLANDLVK